MGILLLLAIPLIALALNAGGAAPRVRDMSYYKTLYRLAPSDPDKWTPGQQQFELGQVVMTPGVENLLTGEDDMQRLRNILVHHQEGDWGDTGTEDSALNDEAVVTGERIMGSHQLGAEKIWVITEWDRSVTTALLPGEY
jgi:hypothetical protein